MCTVSLALDHKTGDFQLISNRDEAPGRITTAPDYYSYDDRKLYYPADAAGGSWIGASDRNRLICLLNGGFQKHERDLPYRISRGVVVKDILTAQCAVKAVKGYDMTSIEPFSIVMVDYDQGAQAYEWIWDGDRSHFRQITEDVWMWQSATLYSDTMKTPRAAYFENFEKNEYKTFHYSETLEDPAINIRMKRPGVETVSITQVHRTNGTLTMKYHDLQTEDVSDNTVIF